jgi:hypothetical protein
MGCAGLLSMASASSAIAQDQGTVPANSPTTSSTTSPEESPAPADAVNPAALPVDSSVTTDPSQISRAQVPGLNQNPANPQPTNIPQFPLQFGNPVSPYTSTSSNPQSPQITAPSLYVTGTNDISQIATSQALSQAFGQPGLGAGFYGDTGVDYEHAPIERLRLGPIDLKAAAVMGVVADDNVRSGNVSSTGKRSDIDFTFTPAVMLTYGLHEGQKGLATLTYSPTLTRFYHESSEDSDDQNVALNVVYPFQRLTLNLTQTYTQSSGVNSDTNSRTNQTAYLSTFGGTYEVDEKISLSSQIQYIKSSFSGNSGGSGSNGSNANGTGNTSGGQGGETISLNNAATYRLSEKLTVGPNFNIGMDTPDDTAKSTFEQGLIGLNYAPTEKIGLFAQGGAEFRQYEMGGGDKVNPVFAVGIGYTPFDSTTLSISANQSVHTSTAPIGQANGGQSVVTTGVGATVTQRIVQRIFVGFSFNYSHEDDQQLSGSAGQFSSTSASGNAGEDNFSYRPTINWAPTAWSSVSLYYQYLANESNLPGQSYNDNQVGLTVSAQF